MEDALYREHTQSGSDMNFLTQNVETESVYGRASGTSSGSVLMSCFSNHTNSEEEKGESDVSEEEDSGGSTSDNEEENMKDNDEDGDVKISDSLPFRRNWLDLKPKDRATEYLSLLGDDDYYSSLDSSTEDNKSTVINTLDVSSHLKGDLAFGLPLSKNRISSKLFMPKRAPFKVNSPRSTQIFLPPRSSEAKDNIDHLSDELKEAYRIVADLMLDNLKAYNLPFLDTTEMDSPQNKDYYDVISKPLWLEKIKEDILDCKYNSMTEVIGDVRLMLENAYRYFGPVHSTSKKGIKLEYILDQKLHVLPEHWKGLCSLELTSGFTKEELNETPRSKAANILVNGESYCSYILFRVRGCRLEREKEKKRKKLEALRDAKKSKELEAVKWEQQLLEDPLLSQMRAMWELPQIGQFLYLSAGALNIYEVPQYELERILLLPQCSSTLAMLMTSLLTPPLQRPKLAEKPFMPYSVWSRKLAEKVKSWYRAYAKEGNNENIIFDQLGIEPAFWNILGKYNPLKKKPFHELTFHQRVSLLKALCDYAMHNHKSVQEAVAEREEEHQREFYLGTDLKGNDYLHFPQFISTDLRIYRRAKLKPPSFSPAVATYAGGSISEPLFSAEKIRAFHKMLKKTKKNLRKQDRDWSDGRKRRKLKKVKKMCKAKAEEVEHKRPDHLRQRPRTKYNDSGSSSDDEPLVDKFSVRSFLSTGEEERVEEAPLGENTSGVQEPIEDTALQHPPRAVSEEKTETQHRRRGKKKRATCELCGKSFSSGPALRGHMSYHNREKKKSLSRESTPGFHVPEPFCQPIASYPLQGDSGFKNTNTSCVSGQEKEMEQHKVNIAALCPRDDADPNSGSKLEVTHKAEFDSEMKKEPHEEGHLSSVESNFGVQCKKEDSNPSEVNEDKKQGFRSEAAVPNGPFVLREDSIKAEEDEIDPLDEQLRYIHEGHFFESTWSSSSGAFLHDAVVPKNHASSEQSHNTIGSEQKADEEPLKDCKAAAVPAINTNLVGTGGTAAGSGRDSYAAKYKDLGGNKVGSPGEAKKDEPVFSGCVKDNADDEAGKSKKDVSGNCTDDMEKDDKIPDYEHDPSPFLPRLEEFELIVTNVEELKQLLSKFGIPAKLSVKGLEQAEYGTASEEEEKGKKEVEEKPIKGPACENRLHKALCNLLSTVVPLDAKLQTACRRMRNKVRNEFIDWSRREPDYIDPAEEAWMSEPEPEIDQLAQNMPKPSSSSSSSSEETYDEDGVRKRKLRRRRVKKQVIPTQTNEIPISVEPKQDGESEFLAVSSRGRIRKVKKIVNYDNMDFEKLAAQAEKEAEELKERKRRRREEEEEKLRAEDGSYTPPPSRVKRYLLSETGKVLGYIGLDGQLHSKKDPRIGREIVPLEKISNSAPKVLKKHTAFGSPTDVEPLTKDPGKTPTVVVAAVDSNDRPVFVRVVGVQALQLASYMSPSLKGSVSQIKLQHQGLTYVVHSNAAMVTQNVPGFPDGDPSTLYSSAPKLSPAKVPVTSKSGTEQLPYLYSEATSVPANKWSCASSSVNTTVGSNSIGSSAVTPNTFAMAYQGVYSTLESGSSSQSAKKAHLEAPGTAASLNVATHLVSAAPSVVPSVSPMTSPTVSQALPPSKLYTNNESSGMLTEQASQKVAPHRAVMVQSVASGSSMSVPSVSSSAAGPGQLVLIQTATGQQLQVKFGSSDQVSQLMQRVGQKIVALPNGKGGYTLTFSPTQTGQVSTPQVQPATSAYQRVNSIGAGGMVVQNHYNSDVTSNIFSKMASSPVSSQQINVGSNTANTAVQHSEYLDSMVSADPLNTVQMPSASPNFTRQYVIQRNYSAVNNFAARESSVHSSSVASTPHVDANQQVVGISGSSVSNSQIHQQISDHTHSVLASKASYITPKMQYVHTTSKPVYQVVLNQGRQNSGISEHYHQQVAVASSTSHVMPEVSVSNEQHLARGPLSASKSSTVHQQVFAYQPMANEQQAVRTSSYIDHTNHQAAPSVNVAHITQQYIQQMETPLRQVQRQEVNVLQGYKSICSSSQQLKEHGHIEQVLETTSSSAPCETSSQMVAQPIQQQTVQTGKLVLLQTNHGEKVGIQFPDGRITILTSEQMQPLIKNGTIRFTSSTQQI